MGNEALWHCGKEWTDRKRASSQRFTHNPTERGSVLCLVWPPTRGVRSCGCGRHAGGMVVDGCVEPHKRY